MEKRILVTGGTGMVGNYLKEILPDAMYIGSKDFFEKNIKKGSITDYDEINPIEERTINKVNINKLKINGKNIKDRLPSKFEEVKIDAPGYYLNNRIIFLKFHYQQFLKYRL